MSDICSKCLQVKDHCTTAVVDGEYYSKVCRACLGTTNISSAAAGYDRRRQYEDNAADTIQPYDATGTPRPEFFRLYPDTAKNVFSPAELEQVKRKI